MTHDQELALYACGRGVMHARMRDGVPLDRIVVDGEWSSVVEVAEAAGLSPNPTRPAAGLPHCAWRAFRRGMSDVHRERS